MIFFEKIPVKLVLSGAWEKWRKSSSEEARGSADDVLVAWESTRYSRHSYYRYYRIVFISPGLLTYALYAKVRVVELGAMIDLHLMASLFLLLSMTMLVMLIVGLNSGHQRWGENLCPSLSCKKSEKKIRKSSSASWEACSLTCLVRSIGSLVHRHHEYFRWFVLSVATASHFGGKLTTIGLHPQRV